MAYKVYVSATQRGLEDYLNVVREAILRMEMHPVMWQDFSAANEQDYTVTFTRQKIEESDLFIGIYAHRYGWIPTSSDISMVEMEYGWASERKMPILVFCVDSSIPWPVGFVEHDPICYHRLENFKERLFNERLVTRFTTPDNLQAQVYLGLSRLSAQKDRQQGIVRTQPIFGPPPQDTQFHADVFMIMPFAPEFRPLYQDFIKPAVEEINKTIKRGDDFFSAHSIMTDVWGAIYHSRYVIAECTGRNANVNYELGIAHTLGKPAIMLTQKLDDIPFDLRHLRIIVYDNTPEGLAIMKQELKSAMLRLI